MHCKVYLCPNMAAVVGSANLSQSALSEAEISGQDEAAVQIRERYIVKEIGDWFNALWRDSRTERIKVSDVAVAKDVWNRARKARIEAGLRTDRRRTELVVPPIPLQFDPTVMAYARKVRGMRLGNLRKEIGEAAEFVA